MPGPDTAMSGVSEDAQSVTGHALGAEDAGRPHERDASAATCACASIPLGADASTSNCPRSAKTNPTSAEQKRLTDTAKEIKRIRKRRQDYVNDKKRGRT